MKIISATLRFVQLKEMAAASFVDMVKAVVDLDRDIIALDAELHSDLELELLKDGSSQASLWGINLYPDAAGEDFVEFDSMINLRPSQGNRSRSVDDAGAQARIRDLVARKIVR